MTGLPSRSTVTRTDSPSGTSPISFATSVVEVTFVPPTARSMSRTSSLPSAGMPSVTLTTSITGWIGMSSWVSAAATAASWEVTISTCPSWVSCFELPVEPYWAKNG